MQFTGQDQARGEETARGMEREKMRAANRGGEGERAASQKREKKKCEKRGWIQRTEKNASCGLVVEVDQV